MQPADRKNFNVKLIIVMPTDFPHYEGLSQRVIGLFSNSVKYGSFTVLAPAVETKGLVSEHVGNISIIRYNLHFLRMVLKNRILYRLLFNAFFSLSLLLDLARLRNLKADFIQAEEQISLIQSLIIGIFLRKPVIVDDVSWMNEAEMGLRIPKLVIQIVRIIEKKALNSCVAAIYSSEEMRKKYPLTCPSFVIPNGISMSSCQLPHISRGKTLLFLGSMYNQQNRQAASAAMRIFQSVKKRHNDIELIIAGGPASMIDGPLIELAGKEKNVKILGYVSNELKSDLIASAGLIILPYFNSPLTGGCRIKTLEFFSQGKVVVSTPDGIAGINGVANRKNVLMAQTFREFVDIINECLSNPASYMKIGDEAMKLAEGYTWENIATSYQNALISLSLHEIAEDKGRAS